MFKNYRLRHFFPPQNVSVASTLTLKAIKHQSPGGGGPLYEAAGLFSFFLGASLRRRPTHLFGEGKTNEYSVFRFFAHPWKFEASHFSVHANWRHRRAAEETNHCKRLLSQLQILLECSTKMRPLQVWSTLASYFIIFHHYQTCFTLHCFHAVSRLVDQSATRKKSSLHFCDLVPHLWDE